MVSCSTQESSFVRTDNLESARIPEAKWHKSRAIVERLNRLYSKGVESSVIAAIKSMSSRAITQLSEIEEELLRIAERFYP